MPVEEQNGAGEEKGTGSIVGIIYPPPELRALIDSTSKFVARVGLEFEEKIKKEKGDKLTFLKNTDPYHAYYQMKIKEFKSGNVKTAPGVKTQEEEKKAKEEEIEEEPKKPVLPPPDFEFLVTVPTIAAMDISLVKLTAQFVAKNGRSFLLQLMQKEAQNYLFDFLRPHHILFGYFTKLVEQYTKIMVPSKDTMDQLKEERTSRDAIMARVNHRVAWKEQEEFKKKETQDKVELEKRNFLAIDWHDFLIAETVDFPESDTSDLPPLVTKALLKQRVLMQERYEREQQNKANGIEIDEESENEVENIIDDFIEQEYGEPEEEEFVPPEPEEPYEIEEDIPEQSSVITQPKQEEIKILSGYDPKAKVTGASGPAYTQCPNCKQSILASEIAEHLRVELLDPRWREHDERRRAEIADVAKTYASGVDMNANLKKLSKKRTDIFEGEELGGQKNGKEKPKITWDGYTSSMQATTKAAQASISHEDKVNAMMKSVLGNPEADKIGPNFGSGPPPQQQQQQQPLLQPPQSVPFQPPQPHPSRAIPNLSNIPAQQSTAEQLKIKETLAQRERERLQVQQKIQEQLKIQEQQKKLQQQQQPMFGSLPPGFNTPGFPAAGMPPGMPPMFGQPEYMAKRPKMDGALFDHMPPVLFTVSVPSNPDKPEWKLYGQTITVSLKLSQTVGELKSTIQSMLGMPTSKQKLQIASNFLKDSDPLAAYNISTASVVQLTIKERGGRKK